MYEEKREELQIYIYATRTYFENVGAFFKNFSDNQLVQSAQKNFFNRQSRAISQFDGSRTTEELYNSLKMILQKLKIYITFGIIKWRNVSVVLLIVAARQRTITIFR